MGSQDTQKKCFIEAMTARSFEFWLSIEFEEVRGTSTVGKDDDYFVQKNNAFGQQK